MKTNQVVLLLSVLISLAAQSQVQLKRYQQGQAVGGSISGTVQAINVWSDTIFSPAVFIENNGNDTLSIAIKRERFNAIDCWKDAMLISPIPDPNFEGSHYAYTQMPTNPWVTPISMNLMSAAYFEFELQTTGQGCTTYRYTVLSSGVPIDSVDYQVCSQATSICETAMIESTGIPFCTVYPNPFESGFSIDATQSQTCKLFDQTGNLVQILMLQNGDFIETDFLKSGIYFLEIQQETGDVTKQKLIKL